MYRSIKWRASAKAFFRVLVSTPAGPEPKRRHACYFDPKRPATQRTIAEHLGPKFANLSRSDVVRALKNLETYQRNFPPERGFGRTIYKGGIM